MKEAKKLTEMETPQEFNEYESDNNERCDAGVMPDPIKIQSHELLKDFSKPTDALTPIPKVTGTLSSRQILSTSKRRASQESERFSLRSYSRSKSKSPSFKLIKNFTRQRVYHYEKQLK